MKYCGGHNLPTNNVNTVTLFLMYRVIRISCLLRAILAELRSGATEEASIASINIVIRKIMATTILH